MTQETPTMGCNDNLERYKEVCKPAFDRIEKQLSKINESLNGNGKPGILTRLNSLEGFWGMIRPAIISIITAGVIGGGVLTLKPEPVSADQIAEVVRQVIKETNK
jgi:hypothetical protein